MEPGSAHDQTCGQCGKQGHPADLCALAHLVDKVVRTFYDGWDAARPADEIQADIVRIVTGESSPETT